jgi:transcriptional regulator with XRE-family HTH domain
MNKELAKSIGSAARQARTALELTQEDAAERLGVSVEFYARIERGNSLPSVPTLARIAAVLGVSADALLGRAVFVPGAAPGWPASPPTEAPEIRRVTRMLRRASPGALRLVTMLLKEIERRAQGSAEGDGGGAAEDAGADESSGLADEDRADDAASESE